MTPEIIDPKLEFDYMNDLEDVEYIVVHHTAVAIDQTVEEIHNFHKNTRGWSGIGYHYYIRFEGGIYKGRPDEKQGVHTPGKNSKSLAVCVAGNFSEENLLERQEQFESLVAVLKWLKEQYPKAEIGGHSDYANSQCPGTKFPWGELLERVS